MDVNSLFDEVNSDEDMNGSYILFGEFARWAISVGLDLEDDDDYD